VAKHPLLSPEEEYELAVRHYEEGDIPSAHRLVTSNLRLVVKIANDFRQAHINMLDLIQEGNAGLMQAVKKFNPYKGVKLSTYAAWWIRAYILKHIMDNKSQVRIGTTAAQRKLFFNLKKEAEKLLQEYDHIDTKLLAESLDVKERDVIEMQKRLSAPDLSLDAPLRTDDGSDAATRGSVIAAEIEPADEMLANNQLRALFAEHLEEFKATLRERDLEIFNDRLLSEQPLTLQEVGDRYGISRERARQIEARIINSLKKFVDDKGVIDIDVER
jgi:RNA polymerase sigma-32 factor